MAPELSSNWKKLQAKIKAESASTSTKRKISEGDDEETGNRGRSGEARKKRKVVKDLSQGKQSPRGSRTTTAAVVVARKPSEAAVATRKEAPSAAKPKMGVAQSSKVTQATPNTVSPSLALWAADNDISPEDIAEAYGLGIKSSAFLTASATQPNAGLAAGGAEGVGKYIAMDCEMVGVGPGGHDSALARVSVVDFHGRQVYDSFVRPLERVTDWRTAISGVGPKHMAAARTFDEVQQQVAELLRGRILVGHDLKHDLAALALKHPPRDTRDTAKFSGFKRHGHGPKPSLRAVAREELGVEIQSGQHSSTEDARTAMLLFRRNKPQFDAECVAKYPEPKPSKPAEKDGTKPKKKKKKKRKN